MTDIEATIARVLELDEKATPGPWGDVARGMQHRIFYYVDGGRYPATDMDTIIHYRTAAPELARECRRLRTDNAAFEEVLKDLDDTAGAVIRDDAGVWDCVCDPNPMHDGSCPVNLRNEVETVFDQVEVLKRTTVRMRALRQRIIDAACLRDDVSDDDLVDAVRRLASPSGEVRIDGN